MATVLCLGLATAVIVGSKVVGDSVRRRLRLDAVRSLGDIVDVVGSASLFSPNVATALRSPAVLRLEGSAANDGDDFVPGVQVWGVGDDFPALFPARTLPKPTGARAVVGAGLAARLKVGEGDPLFLAMAPPSGAPAGSLFARTGLDENLRQARVTVFRVLPDDGPLALNLAPGVKRGNSVFVDRAWLSKRLGREDVANTLLSPRTLAPPSLQAAFSLSDRGLALRPGNRPGIWHLHSDRLTLSDAEVAEARVAARRLGGEARRTSVALASRVVSGGLASSYAVVAWREGDDRTVLGDWVAKDLGAKTGDRLEIRALVSQPDGSTAEVPTSVRVGGIEPTQDDRNLVPAFEGMTGAASVADWDPPFPVDMSRVAARDETYWEAYRATPKLLTSEAVLRQAWGGRLVVTGMELTLPPGVGPAGFGEELAAAMPVEASGIRLDQFRDQRLAAAEGSTDLAGLLQAMGAFLIVVGAWMAWSVGMLATLERSRELALLRAMGLPRRRAGLLAAIEGAAIGMLGGAAGILFGLAFARASLAMLSAQLPGSLGLADVPLAFSPAAGLLGWIVATVGGAVASWAAWRAAGRTSVVGGLRGEGLPAANRRSPSAAFLVWAALGLAVWFAFRDQPALLRFAGSAVGLGMALSGSGALARRLGALARARPGFWPHVARSVAARPRRFRLGAWVMGASVFTLAAVAGSLRPVGLDGANGYDLVATTSVPVSLDFGTMEGRERLGFPPEDEAAWRGVEVARLWRRDGDDASCLNPAKPVAPAVVGVPMGAWPGTYDGIAEPIPISVDRDTALWTWKTGVGSVLALPGGVRGVVRELHPPSLLSPYAATSEAAFRLAYPSVAGPSLFLLKVPDGKAGAVEASLVANLGQAGVEVRPSSEILGEMASVQNGYMAVFLAFGGLGLLLGALGTGLLVARQAIERKGELAVLWSLGVGRGRLAGLLAAETGASVVWGGALGAVAGLAAADAAGAAVLGVLGGTLATCAAALAVSGIAARRSVNCSLVEAMRCD